MEFEYLYDAEGLIGGHFSFLFFPNCFMSCIRADGRVWWLWLPVIITVYRWHKNYYKIKQVFAESSNKKWSLNNTPYYITFAQNFEWLLVFTSKPFLNYMNFINFIRTRRNQEFLSA